VDRSYTVGAAESRSRDCRGTHSGPSPRASASASFTLRYLFLCLLSVPSVVRRLTTLGRRRPDKRVRERQAKGRHRGMKYLSRELPAPPVEDSRFIGIYTSAWPACVTHARPRPCPYSAGPYVLITRFVHNRISARSAWGSAATLRTPAPAPAPRSTLSLSSCRM